MDIVTIYTVGFYLSIFIPILIVYMVYSKDMMQVGDWRLQTFGSIYVLCLVLFIGFRRLGFGGFQDTPMYIDWFVDSKTLGIVNKKDIGFGIWTFLLSKIIGVRLFFIISSFLSFISIVWVCMKIAKEKWFLMLLGFLVSIYFWNQQVFTIRQGIASNLFLVGLFQKKGFFKYFFLLLSVTFHKSFLLPLLGFIVVGYIKKTDIFLMIWCCTLIVSSIFNNRLLQMLSKVLNPKTFNYMLYTNDYLSLHFRWDIVVFSLVFMAFGLFQLKVNKGHYDGMYVKILNLYILMNIFILILGKSNIMYRFTYLSWFLIPLILFYPLFTNNRKFEFPKYLIRILGMYFMVISYVGYKIYTQNYKFVADQDINTEIKY